MGYSTRPDKTQGIEASDLPTFLPHFDTTILECDGARNRPLKVHNEQDPRVPDCCTHVIIVVGGDVVGTGLKDGFVHRPDMFADTWPAVREGKLSASFIAEVVTTRKGYLSKVPDTLEPLYLVNKAEQYPQQTRELATAIAARTGRPAVVASLDEEAWEWIE
jgi:probable selenium-dependent hydroxylase accessory protein YqeC